MISSISIQNFKCYKKTKIEQCKSINVLVGENGTGKTALLEAIFFALGTTSELAVRFRAQRGLDGAFSGSSRQIEEAIWRDFFFGGNWDNDVSIKIKGDGAESRSVTISHGSSRVSLPSTSVDERDEKSGSITVTWLDSDNKPHIVHPVVSRNRISFDSTDEDLPSFFFFSSSQTSPATESAGRFSHLSRTGQLQKFVDVFTAEYKWIANLSIEVIAGAPMIYATLRDGGNRLPAANVSGGVNRMLSIMLAIAAHPKSIVLVDEIENGIYHKHQAGLWKALLAFVRAYDSQLFVTTHNEEWLGSLFKASAGKLDDVAFWRSERTSDGPRIHRFTGKQAEAAFKAGEVR